MLRTGTFMKQARFSKSFYAHCRIGVALYESSFFVVSGRVVFMDILHSGACFKLEISGTR